MSPALGLVSPMTQRKNEVGSWEGREQEANSDGEGLVQNVLEEERQRQK